VLFRSSGVWSAWAIENFARLGVLWHFLDLVWIGIFSVVYLPEFVS
jgi:cytochrome o ubiquinol oxidase subunit 3